MVLILMAFVTGMYICTVMVVTFLVGMTMQSIFGMQHRQEKKSEFPLPNSSLALLMVIGISSVVLAWKGQGCFYSWPTFRHALKYILFFGLALFPIKYFFEVFVVRRSKTTSPKFLISAFIAVLVLVVAVPLYSHNQTRAKEVARQEQANELIEKLISCESEDEAQVVQRDIEKLAQALDAKELAAFTHALQSAAAAHDMHIELKKILVPVR